MNSPLIPFVDAIGVQIQIEDDGQAGVLAMTLVRTHHVGSGHALTELILADGSSWTELGFFDISSEGLITLSVDTNLPGAVNYRADAKQLADRLMALLVEHSGAWGLEAFEACS